MRFGMAFVNLQPLKQKLKEHNKGRKCFHETLPNDSCFIYFYLFGYAPCLNH